MKTRITADESSLKRIVFLTILALIVCSMLIVRLFQIQIVDRGKYVEIARNQYLYESEVKSDRGGIFDRKLRYLAINKNTWSLGVDVTKIDNPDSAAYYFSTLFQKSKNHYLELLEGDRSFFWLARGVGEDIVNKIEQLKIPGIRVIKEAKRYYPQNRLAAQLVGFTDIDLNGLSGVELLKNQELKGKHGKVVYQKDALGKTVAEVGYPNIKPESGMNIILTIDNTYQWIAEEELRYVIDKFEADAATVVITNPMTGEVLAMAIQPDFNPNNAGEHSPERWRNRAITDGYEPGSTFKPVVMSAILEEGLKSPKDIIFCENGKYHIYGQDLADVGSYGWLTLKDIIKKSSNIGMAKLSQEIDKNIIYRYVRDFGFGMKTGIELPGETSGELKNTNEWSSYTAIAMSIGYEIAVTPIQMAMAYGAIANGGYLLKPQIYLGTVDELGTNVEVAQPEVIRRVISDSTSSMVKSMLEDVVFEGTGKRASITGLKIAGKTGTAKKYDPNIQRYSDNKFISSFIGFFPAEDPKLLMYVVIDNPKKDHLGGMVAAPTFKRILQRIIRVMEIETPYVSNDVKPTEDNPIKSEKLIRIPELVNKRIEIAEKIIDNLGLELVVEAEGEIVQSQNPVAGTKVNPGAQITLKLKEFNIGSNGKYTTVPKVVGMPLRDALKNMSREGLRVVVQGSGQVVNQIPTAGKKIRVGARCVVQCEPAIDLAEFVSW